MVKALFFHVSFGLFYQKMKLGSVCVFNVLPNQKSTTKTHHQKNSNNPQNIIKQNIKVGLSIGSSNKVSNIQKISG